MFSRLLSTKKVELVFSKLNSTCLGEYFTWSFRQKLTKNFGLWTKKNIGQKVPLDTLKSVFKAASNAFRVTFWPIFFLQKNLHFLELLSKNIVWCRQNWLLRVQQTFRSKTSLSKKCSSAIVFGIWANIFGWCSRSRFLPVQRNLFSENFVGKKIVNCLLSLGLWAKDSWLVCWKLIFTCLEAKCRRNCLKDLISLDFFWTLSETFRLMFSKRVFTCAKDHFRWKSSFNCYSHFLAFSQKFMTGVLQTVFFASSGTIYVEMLRKTSTKMGLQAKNF